MSNDPRHDAAVALLARRSPEGYSADEYVAAYDEVNASVRRDILKRALIEVGAADPEDEIVTENLLLTRAHNILREQGGFFEYHGGDSIRLPDDDEQLEALRQAIKELGKPGEKRKDLAQMLASRRDEIIDSAIADGKLFASGREAWVAMYDKNSEQVVATLAAIPVHPDIVAARKTGYEMDPASFELDQAAKLLLREAGLIDERGAESYDSEAYVKACTAVDQVEAHNVVRLRDEARKAGYTNASFVWHAENIAAWVASAIEEENDAARGA